MDARLNLVPLDLITHLRWEFANQLPAKRDLSYLVDELRRTLNGSSEAVCHRAQSRALAGTRHNSRNLMVEDALILSCTNDHIFLPIKATDFGGEIFQRYDPTILRCHID